MSHAHIDLELAPHWELIDITREFLQSFFNVTLRDDALVGQVCLATHELMENAIKYSVRDEVHLKITVTDRHEIKVTVMNWALAEHIPIVIAEADALNSAPDPFAYYQERMEHSFLRTDGKSCLGLARIRCEAQMRIDCHVADGRVHLSAFRPAAAA